MSNALHATIRQLTDTFAEGVLRALRSASLDEIRGESSGRRGPGRPRGTRETAAPRVPAAAGPRRGRRRAPGSGADTLLDEMVEILKKNPKGLRSEELRARLKAEKVPFRLVAKEAVSAN